MSKTTTEALDIEAAALANSLDDLNRALEGVEKALRDRLFKSRTKVAIPQENGEIDRHFLVWDRHVTNGWSLQILTRPETGDAKSTPMVQAPWQLRVRATTCFEALLVQASLELRHKNKDVQDAITRCADFAKKIQEAP